MEKRGENSGWRKRKSGGKNLPGGDCTSGFETEKRKLLCELGNNISRRKKAQKEKSCLTFCNVGILIHMPDHMLLVAYALSFKVLAVPETGCLLERDSASVCNDKCCFMFYEKALCGACALLLPPPPARQRR